MVFPNGNRQAEEFLKNAVYACTRQKILTPGHMGNALFRIVRHNGQMITGQTILAGENYISQHAGMAHLAAKTQILPGEVARQRGCPRAIQPPCMSGSGSDQLIPEIGW